MRLEDINQNNKREYELSPRFSYSLMVIYPIWQTPIVLDQVLLITMLEAHHSPCTLRIGTKPNVSRAIYMLRGTKKGSW
jgi:hypothetical protein